MLLSALLATIHYSLYASTCFWYHYFTLDVLDEQLFCLWILVLFSSLDCICVALIKGLIQLLCKELFNCHTFVNWRAVEFRANSSSLEISAPHILLTCQTVGIVFSMNLIVFWKSLELSSHLQDRFFVVRYHNNLQTGSNLWTIPYKRRILLQREHIQSLVPQSRQLLIQIWTLEVELPGSLL